MQAWTWLEGEAHSESAAVRTGDEFQADIPPFAPRRPDESEDRGDELQTIDFTPRAAPPPSLAYRGEAGQAGQARQARPPSSQERRISDPHAPEEEEEEEARRHSSQYRGVSWRYGRWKARTAHSPNHKLTV